MIRKSLSFLWISHFFVDFFTGIWPIYKTIAGIDIAKAGLIVGIAGFTGEIMQPLFGYISDLGHRKKVLIAGLALCATILFIPLSNNLLFSFIILLMMMMGSAAFHPAAAGMAHSLETTKKTRALLIFNSGGSVGFGLSQIVFCSLFYSYKSMIYLLILLPAVWIVFLLFHNFPLQKSTLSSSYFNDRLQTFLRHKKALSLLYFSQVMYQGMRATFLFFLPEVLRARCANPWIWQGGGFLFFVLGTVLSIVPAGHLGDKYGQKKVLLCIVSITIALYYVLVMSQNLSFYESLILLTCLGAVFGIINPLTISWGQSLVPENPSTVSGLLMGFAWCVGNLGPAFAGGLHAHFQQNADQLTLSIMGTLLIGVFFLLFSTPQSESKPIKI